MSSHLLALSVGPVQEFIAASRRTRDLWFGSYLLSEISKAVARSVRIDGGKLIFPSPDNADELEPQTGSDDDARALNVANIIIAELKDRDPSVVVQNAKNAARARWRKFADDVFDDPKITRAIREEIWKDQVNDVVEFYAAWVPFNGANYPLARKRVTQLLAGRKNCRDFCPAKGRAKVPKSSLDGLRESVLVERRDDWSAKTKRSLRVRDGEQLDVVGVVKRAAGGDRPYPSVSRVAADPWLRGVKDDDLEPFKEVCASFGGNALHRLDTEIYPRYERFPYEGTAVYRNRYKELEEETGVDIKPLADALKALTDKHKEPNPYLSVLVADGDRMGPAISELKDIGEHQAFSKALSTFAESAKAIVREHRGVLVYAGGDDVLAFLPVDQCLSCARKLHDTFGELLKEQSKETKQELTLSVGVAIAHFLDNLEDLLNFGREAEKHAKNPQDDDRKPDGTKQEKRNGLAVHLLKRGGSPITVRANWSDDLDERLATMAEWLADGKLPTRLANELRGIADAYERWDDGNALENAIQKDALRVVGKKQPPSEGAMGNIGDMIRARVKNAATLKRFANELLVARQMETALRQIRHETAQGDDE
ncbi:type III-B CRISPR-associated protein Cas10/Cmr2 [Candidatus Poribacteria bacterium]|nr:type III-B CRISPR-associated protein Cas10/Cmr2 [Candidatus Poribacteria bacterium]